MDENTNTGITLDSNKKPNFKEKLNAFVQLPSIFHGTLMGLVLLAAKVVFYITQNWTFVFEPPFMFFSFALLVYAVFMASKAEKKIYDNTFTYWKAFLSGFRVISIAIFISILADGILYGMDNDLSSQTVQIQIEKSVEAFKNISFMKEIDKDKIIKELKKQDPSSLSSLTSALIGKILSNGVFLFLTSIFFRFKRKHNDWLNAPENEG